MFFGGLGFRGGFRGLWEGVFGGKSLGFRVGLGFWGKVLRGFRFRGLFGGEGLGFRGGLGFGAFGGGPRTPPPPARKRFRP